jgi:low density lipoprotein receptor-related protein 5/6
MKREAYSLRHATAAFLATLVATGLMTVDAGAKVYFSAFLAEGTGIERAGFDGSRLQTLQSEPAGFEDGLALDVAGGRMFWTDTNASVIASANLNGTGEQIVLDDFGQEPLGIALDVAAGKMYWTDREGVKRANLDGTGSELVTKEPARGFPALDLTARRIYWADWPSGTVKSAAMSPEAAVTNVVTKQPAPFGVGVDHAGGKVYWIELDLNKKTREKDEIRRANLDGSEVQTLVERPGAGFEGGLAIDPAAGKLYWGEAEAHDIGVANLDGSQAQTLFSTGEAIPVGLAVEGADPRPANTAAPVIEGNPQVGSPLRCNPGAWAGIGSVSLAYQWATAGVGGLEGAIGNTYVPSFEDSGTTLVCAITAADSVETTTTTSAGVRVGPLPAPPAAPRARLFGGIAFQRLRSVGRRARVPVFTTLPGIATLRATPIGRRRPRARGITVRRQVSSGHTELLLQRLVPGVSYRLLLTIRSADGQLTRDTATLKVIRR